jgi:hypothetical protein
MIDRKLTQGPSFTLKDLLIAHAAKCVALKREKDEVHYSAWSLMNDIVEANASGERYSFLDLWHRYNEGEFPGGYGPMKALTTELEIVSGVCEAYGLPLLSMLVVDNGTRELSPAAMKAFWEDPRRKSDLVVAHSKEEFAQQMTALARNVTKADLDALV